MAKATTKKQGEYNAKSITELEFPDNVRHRPNMYIGPTGIAGNTHLVQEIVDNGVDEALCGFGTEIKCEISQKRGMCRVTDGGRGIPQDAIEKAFCKLHASGKFDDGSYTVSGGLNGVGASCTNALSTNFNVTSMRDGYIWTQTFEKGIKTSNLKKGKATKKTGTIVEFFPDITVMKSIEFDLEFIKQNMEMKSYINRGIKFIVVDLDNDETFTYYHKEGIKEYIKNNVNNLQSDIIMFSDDIEEDIEIKQTGSKGEKVVQHVRMHIEVAFAYGKQEGEDIKSYCNSIYTPHNGTHVTGFKMSIGNKFKAYATSQLPKKDAKLEITGDDVRDGLVAVVSVNHNSPEYSGQTKDELTNKEAQGFVMRICNKHLDDYIANNEKEMKKIAAKIILSAKARLAGKKAREATAKKGESELEIVSDLGKLADCISKDVTENEIYLVEGDSAGGSAKQGRKRETQAIYCFKGKPVNVFGKTPISVLSNKEMADLTYILTGEKNGIGSNFDINKLKYGRVIIMSDADVDGKHIRCLTSCHLAINMRELVEAGRLFIALPPLYSIIENGKKRYFLDEQEYQKYIKKQMRDLFEIEGINSTKEFNGILVSLKQFLTAIEKIQNLYGINGLFIEDLAYELDGKKPTDKLILELLSKRYAKYTSIIKEKTDNGVEIKGIFEGNFISTQISTLTKIIKTVNALYEKLNLDKSYKYTYKRTNESKEIYPVELYKLLEEKATPKSRARLKGLGEMNPDELFETTMNPETRNIIQVTIEDYDKAYETLDMFFSDKNADKRKAFLLKNQDKAKDLDV